ncbi:hypothetical protein TR2A62_2401 [Thalassobium sp. R2A62]|nr:hypothetical protein TR2A62_2401 [Thalassobium sp. R2A62]
MTFTVLKQSVWIASSQSGDIWGHTQSDTSDKHEHVAV